MTDWQPIEQDHPPANKIVWLATPSTMRLGFWADGKQHENFGTVGGGYIDLARSEGTGPRGLPFAPTHWQPVPQLPKPAKGSIPASEWTKRSNLQP